MIWCPIGVPKALSNHFRFELLHRGDDIGTLRFDVVAKRDVHVRMPEYGLDNLVRYAEPVQICPQPAPSGMPSMPAGQTIVALEFVTLLDVQLVI